MSLYASKRLSTVINHNIMSRPLIIKAIFLRDFVAAENAIFLLIAKK
jgi:hypothetical protein